MYIDDFSLKSFSIKHFLPDEKVIEPHKHQVISFESLCYFISSICDLTLYIHGVFYRINDFYKELTLSWSFNV